MTIGSRSANAYGGWIATALNGPIEWLKNTLTFHPDKKLKTSPAEHGLSYEEVRFGGADGRTLYGWYIPGRSQRGPGADLLFLWFHGNAGHIGHRLKHVRLLHEQIGGSHFLFDYQGFGLSYGKPTLAGIIQDGRDALNFVQTQGWSAGRRVVYFGESLGGSVALTIACEQTPDCAILSAPFYSLQAMGKIRVPPLAFLVEHDLNNARLMRQLTAPLPLLVIHGTEDRTVPFQQGYDLYALAPQPKTFLKIEGGGHTNLHEVGGELYLRTIRGFMAPGVST